MSRLALDLFCEDAGHEHFARALVLRLAREAAIQQPDLRVKSAVGGHGQAITELKAWQRFLLRGADSPGDALLVFIDGNGEGWANQHRAIAGVVDQTLFPAAIVGCPDPHIEAWCTADPEALQRLGIRLPPPPGVPGRYAYKRWLRDALADVALTDPMEIAHTLVPELDLFKAAKAQPSLGKVVIDLQALFKRATP